MQGCLRFKIFAGRQRPHFLITIEQDGDGHVLQQPLGVQRLECVKHHHQATLHVRNTGAEHSVTLSAIALERTVERENGVQMSHK